MKDIGSQRIGFFILSISLVLCVFESASGSFFPKYQTSTIDLTAFSALAPIDAHAHVFKNDPAFTEMLKRLNLHIMDVCVVDKHDRGYEEIMHSTKWPFSMVLHI